MINRKNRIEKLRKLGVQIGENCSINATAFIDILCGKLIIGDNVIITRFVRILTHDGSDKITGKTHKNITIIKDGAFIGLGSIILTGVTIGKNSIIGAGSVVTKDVPDGEIWIGNPARKLEDLK